MAMIPQYFRASTKEVAEQALAKGYLKYPGICSVEDGSYFIWVTKENQMEFIGGYNQITGIDYKDGLLCFMSGDNVLYTADVAMTPETADRIKDEIVSNLDLASYAKSDDVARLLDSKIGDIGDKATVSEYVDDLSYDRLKDAPITNLYGSLTKTVVVSELSDGVYQIAGQFKIGGEHQTIQMASDDSLFVVARDHGKNTVYLTQLLGNTMKLYTLDPDGKCTTDRYITDSYISDKDFITSSEVKDYVKTLVTDAIVETIDAVLDVRLDLALDRRISGIPNEDIVSIFSEKRKV